MITIDCKKKISDDFSIDTRLEINKGSFVCLYGRSGSGKTTLLRILAGFLRADSGSIKDGDRVLQEGNEFLSAGKRRIGFLFQDYALFENMSVTGNLLFARNDPQKAAMLLEILELSEFAKSGVEGLSGGQKQRVALARALMQEPEILLLDEPLSALDFTMREKIQEYLLKIHEQFHQTVILVSHDVSEIYRLCKRVYEMKDGRIVRTGTPEEIFLKTSGSQKFSFAGKIVDLQARDGVKVAVVAIGSQLCEVVLSNAEADGLQVGDEVKTGAKAFNITLRKI
ncbi:ATP-binding cassette domain-containing protein [uncultured Campylobacter sp.]|uniref:ABC transporter ATP-binding protein n=1 Tax=uncultured Campylobacter sp. TaxID=218934 RepID=UPI002615A63D|nr:ATP-binding cassette domain-containing protein [uncultured Campylobacter sp.]